MSAYKPGQRAACAAPLLDVGRARRVQPEAPLRPGADHALQKPRRSRVSHTSARRELRSDEQLWMIDDHFGVLGNGQAAKEASYGGRVVLR
jgi:hypothetical protein